MLNQNYNTETPYMQILISQFQNFLNYLFNLRDKINNANIYLFNYLNDENSDINRLKNQYNNKIDDNKELIRINMLNIKELQKKLSI